MYLHTHSTMPLVATLAVFGSIFLAGTLHAATAVPGGPVGVAALTGLPCSDPHLATEEEVAASPTGTIVAGVTWLCPESAALGITAEAGKAKIYLLSIARDLRNSQAPPTKERIGPLHNSFAICAAKFLNTYEQTVGPIYVVSAFRCGPYSPAEMTCNRDENRKAGGATRSNHQLGLALDVNPADGNYERLHEFARLNPQYGVWFRLGMSDRPHLEPFNRENPSCSGVAGTPAPIPNVRAPTSDLTDQFRDFIHSAEQKCTLPDGTSVKCSAIANLGNSPTTGISSGLSGISTGLSSSGSGGSQTTGSSREPETCAPKFFCKGSVRYYQTSACTEQINEVCARGCSSGACIGPSERSDPLTAALNEAKSTSTKATSTQTTSASDLINAIANPDPVGVPANPETIDVIVGSGEARRLEDTSASSDTLVPLGSVRTISSGAQQTFVSPDLRNNSAFVVQDFSSPQTTLEAMRQTLLNVLAYLRPFGRPTQHFE